MVEPLPSDFDNPEWTSDDFADARPATDVHAPKIAESLTRSPPEWEAVVLDLDTDVLDKFRATGPDWQLRINEVLRAAELPDDRRDAA